MQNHFYLPLITRPTRFPEGQQRSLPSLLDHIYVNFSPPSITGILKLSISDHLPVFITYLLPASKITHHTVQFRIFKEESRNKFTRELALILWEELLTSDDVNVNFDYFTSLLYRLYNSHFPVVKKSISSKRASHPWITLAKTIENKNASLNDYRMGLISWDAYKIIRNRSNNLLRVVKSNYYVNFFNNFKNNTKKLWESLNTLVKSPVSRSNSPNIIFQNTILNTPIAKANAFNSFFANVGSNLDAKLPPAVNDPMEYMRGDYPHSMQVPHITFRDVLLVIKSLKNKKMPCR